MKRKWWPENVLFITGLNACYIQYKREKMRMYPGWSLCTLYLYTCQVRVTVGNTGLCLLYLCYVFRALINSLVCWFYKVKGMKICSVIRFDACCVRGQRGSEQPLHMVARLLQKTGLPITSAICHYQKAWGTYHCLARQESQFKSTSWVWKIITMRKFPSCVSLCAYLDTCAYYIS